MRHLYHAYQHLSYPSLKDDSEKHSETPRNIKRLERAQVVLSIYVLSHRFILAGISANMLNQQPPLSPARVKNLPQRHPLQLEAELGSSDLRIPPLEPRESRRKM